ncbi:wsv054 [White spot syndrome virus]|uniref:Wsv054 n=2 Tax=White spot syndrome virus TaxID=92652 RepID=Q8VBB5_WSSVS|nr:wsv054 [Shrimp white spot syndrome virus]AAL33058.1 wsv054 [Shrimp white spot syndrome virus]AAL88979.1 WSSV111 [Shrimp white spot syndrome virus]
MEMKGKKRVERIAEATWVSRVPETSVCSRNVFRDFWTSHFWKGLQFIKVGILFLVYISSPSL